MERHSLRRLYGRNFLLKGALFASTALVFPIVAPRPALAQIAPNTTPTGGQVVGGSATIGQAPENTTVNQSSQLAAINWQSFNVGSAAKVQFNQPDASAIALNRVVGGNLSQINGQIDANGQIVLINQSGVVFGRGSQVNAESVVVSTSDIATSDFMAGKMNFTGAPKPGAQIINNGNISARDAGLVGLVAPQVLNNGVITAQLGQVVLAGGAAFTLDLYGDRLISLDVTQAVRAVDVGGKLVPALVTNSGLILADGGKITLTAQDADALVTQLIAAGGTIQANTVGAQTGTISISGVGGNISIAGNLLAQGNDAGQKGGAIQALATGTVAVAPTAIIDASGQAGGGVIALGTDLTRAETGPTDRSAPAAAVVTIAQGAQIRANAENIGNGGTVSLLSQNFTGFGGAIDTQGGPQGGNGGLAEISSRGVISLSGTVTDIAIDGQPGEILLDPATLIVTVAGGQQSTTASEVDSTWLSGLSGNIVLSASSLLEVLSDIKSTSLDQLSLISGGAVSIDALISFAGSLEVDAGTSIQIGGSYSTTGPVTLISDTGGLDANDIYLNGTTGIDIGAKIDILAAGGTLALDSTEGSITDSTIVGVNGLNVATTASGIIDTPTLSGGTAAIGGDVVLDNSQNAIANLLNLTLGAGGTLVLDDAAGLAISNVIAPTTTLISFDDTDAEDFDVTGLLDASKILVFDNPKLTAEANGGTVIAGDLALFGGGDVSLTSGHNSIAILQTVNSLSDLYLDDAKILTIASSIGIGTVFSFTGAGINETGAGLINVPTFTAFNVGGDINLQGANSFANFLADTPGTVSVADTAALAIPGLVSGSSVFITLAAGKALTVETTPGEIDATGAGGTLEIIADSLTLPAAFAGQLQATRGTIIVAPATANRAITFTDLAGGTGLVLGPDFLTDIAGEELALQLGTAASTGNVNLGQSGDNIDLGTGNLSIVTSGDVSQTGALTAGSIAFNTGAFLQTDGNITAAYFTGTAASGIVALDGSATNLIGAFGPITAKNTVALSDDEAANITGTISTNGVIDLVNFGGGYAETGSGALDAATLTTGAGTIEGDADLGNGNNLADLANFTAAGNILLQDTGTLSINGAVFTPDSLTLEDFSGGVLQSAGGITAATLSSGGEIAGTVSLGGQNAITTLSNFQLTSGFGLDLADTGSLTVAGTVSAANIILSDSGTIFLTGGLSAPGLVDLATADGVYQTAGSLTAGSMEGEVTGTGDLSLTSTSNSFANVGDVSINNGSFLLTDLQNVQITGTVTTPDSLILSVTSIGESGSGVIDAGTLNNQLVLANMSLGGQNHIANLAGDYVLAGGGDFYLNDLTALILSNEISAAAVTFGGAGVTESGGGFIVTPGTLSGAGKITGDMLLTSGINNIGALQNLTLAGTLDVANSGNLSLDGISAAAATFSNANAGDSLNFTGPVSVAGALELDFAFGNYAGAGAVTAATLDTAGGTANQVSLTGANSISTLAAFTSDNDFDLNDLANLSIVGALTAPTIALASPEIFLDAAVTAGGIGDPGTIAVITDGITAGAGIQFNAATGTLEIEPYTDTVIDLGGTAAGALDLPGSLFGAAAEIVIGNLPLGNPFPVGNQAVSIVIDAGSFGAGLLVLSAQTGIFDNGTLIADTIAFDGGGFVQTKPAAAILANTLFADAGITGLVSLTSTRNQIVSLGSIDDSADIDLTDGIALTVDGPITGSDIFLADPNAINLAGTVSAASGGTIALLAGDLTAAAGATLTAGTVVLAPFVATDAIDLGGTNFSGLQISQDLLSLIGASVLRVGTAGGGTLYVENLLSIAANELVLTGRSIDIFGTLLGGAGSLISLAAAGAISETASGNIDFATLTGFGGEVALTGANTFATLANFSAASNLTLNDGEAMAIAGYVTTAGTLSLEDAGDITETTGTLVAATLDSGGTALGGNLFLTHSNTIGALGDLTLTAGNSFDLLDTGLLTVAGTVFAPNATIAAGNLAIAGALDGSYLLLATPGTITETTGTIAVATLAGGVIGGAVSLLQSNQIGTITNLSAGGPIGINDGQILSIAGLISTASTIILEGAGATELASGTLSAATLTSDNTVINGNVFLANANPIGVLNNFDVAAGDTLALNVTGALALTGGDSAPNAYLTASSISFAGLETFAQILALESSGEILQASGTITAGTLTSIGTIGGDTELLDANTIANLGAFTVASGATLAIDSTHLFTILGTVAADFAAFSSDTIAIAGSIIGTQLALESTGDIFETTGAISEATLTSGGTTIGGVLSLENGNVVGTIGPIAALGGVTLDNFQTLDIAGQIFTPGAVILQARGDVTEITGGAITAGTFGTGTGTISGALSLLNANSISNLGNLIADGGIALNDVSPLDIAGFVTTAGAITLEGKGGITETGTLDAATLTTGNTTYAGNVLLDGSNAIPDLGNITLAAGGTFDLADTGFLAIGGVVFAPTATITTGSLNIEGALEGTFLALGATGTLAESSGSIAVGTLVSDGVIGGVVVLGNKNNKIGTLGAFAANANILLNNGEALSLAGLVSTPDTLTLEDATAGITELSGGTIAAATLNSGFTQIGGDVLLLNANTIGALGAITLAAGNTFAVSDTGLLTVAGTVFAPAITLASATIAIAGALDATALALESTGNIFETLGTISTATLTSGNTDIGGFLSLANTNSITSLGGITATQSILINDGVAETIAGLVTTAQTITLEDAGSITETSGSLDALELTSANTTIGGNVILTNQNTIATLANMILVSGATLSLTDSETLTLAGTVTAANATFTAPGLVIDGILNDGQVLALAGGSYTEGPDGGIIAGTLTSLGTVDGDVILTGAQNTIGNIQNFTVGSSNDFALADNGLLNISGPLTGGNVVLAAGSLSITSVLTAPTLALEALTGITETGGSLIDTILSSENTTIGGDVALSGANTIATLGNFALTGNFLLANTGTLILAGLLATPTGDVTLEDNSDIIETTGLITAATLDSGGTTLGGNLRLTNANSIGTLGAITLSTGTFDLADAGALTIAGGLTAPDITLATTGALTEMSGGVITAGTLTLPSIGGDATLLQPNAIATLAAATVTGDLSLDDLSALAIDGFVTSTGMITLQDAASVTEISGGTLAAATLTTGFGSIGGAAILTNGNLIGTLQNFAAAGNISFDDAQSYAIAGLVSTPGALDLSGEGFAETTGGGVDAATLLATGTIQGSAVLNQTNTIVSLGGFSVTENLLLNDDGPLDISGAVTAGGTVGLAAIGNVIESGAGAIRAASLTTDGGEIVGAAILNGANSVTSLGAFTASNALLLTDTGPLDLSGQINAGATLGLAVTGDVTELAGATITATSFTTDGGQISGAANLGQTSNQIGTIGDVTVGLGLDLADSRALDFSGDVLIGAPGLSLTVTGADITQSGGTITTPLLNASAANIALTGPNNITDLGAIFTASNATINSDAATGLTLTSTISAGAVLSLSSEFGLNELGAATLLGGNIDLQSGGASTLAGVNLAGNNFSFSGPRGTLTQTGGTIVAGNTAAIAAYYGFTQNAGRLEAANVLIQTTDGVTLAGVISASNSIAIGTADIFSDNAQYLKAANASFYGNEIELGGVNLVSGQLKAIGGQIVQPATGLINAGTLDLVAVGVTGGAMPVYGLSLTGAINAGNATLSGPGIALAGYLSVASLLLVNASDNIDQSGGLIIATGAPVQLNAGTSIVLGGSDDFSAGLAASAGTTFAQTGQLNAGYASVFASDVVLRGGISITNALSLTGFTQIDDEAAGLFAGAAHFAAPAITLNGVNNFATALTATATGDIIQNSNAAAVFAPGATLTAADITLDGTDSFSGALDLIAAGDIFHTSTDTLTAGTLIGSANQNADFTGATDFGTIGSFIMQDSTFVLDNDNSLTIIGPLAANQVSITAVGQITLDGSPQGGLFISGVNEGKTITSPTAIDSVLEVIPVPGSDIGTILQTGTFFINSGPEAALIDNGFFNNAAATLFMIGNTLAGDSLDITFAPAPPSTDGLYGPSITLPISLGPLGTGTGNATLYEIIVFSGLSTQFTGTLDGLAGPASAGKGFVVPNPKPPLQFNACPIGSVNCVILPTEVLPSGNPLQNFDVTQRKRRHLARSVVLPGVATRDF